MRPLSTAPRPNGGDGRGRRTVRRRRRAHLRANLWRHQLATEANAPQQDLDLVSPGLASRVVGVAGKGVRGDARGSGGPRGEFDLPEALAEPSVRLTDAACASTAQSGGCGVRAGVDCGAVKGCFPSNARQRRRPP